MPAEGVFWLAQRQFTEVWAVLAIVFAVVSSLVVGLAVNAVPKSWGWAHNWWLLVGISAGLLVAAALVAVVQARSSAGMTDPGKSSPASVMQRPGADEGEHTGGTFPPRNPVFTGRTRVLGEMERCLAAGPVAVVALRGLGGVGKSQVALEYAHRMRDAGRYRVTGWVRADSPVTIAEDLATLAPLLGLSADGPTGEVARDVVRALGSRRDWLLVFDNAQNSEDLAGWLPVGGGHVLITSRNRVWSGIASQLDLNEFSRAESVRFLGERTRHAEPGAADELAAELTRINS
jgi:hypothetical protein